MIARTLLVLPCTYLATCFATYCVQKSPTRTLCALLAENLSRRLAQLAFVDLNLGNCTAMVFKDRRACVQLVHVKSCKLLHFNVCPSYLF